MRIGSAEAPWHRESFDRFLQEGLPQLLAARLPVAGYRAECGERSAQVAVATGDGSVEVRYEIPCPDAAGLFHLQGERAVVVPVIGPGPLDEAEVRCAGELLLAYVAARLGQAPAGLAWDEELARSWLPLAEWARAFLAGNAQRLDATNWLAGRTHLRRLWRREPGPIWSDAHWGRVCPFEAPEGPNIGRVLTLALGASIRIGRLVIVDPRPEAAVGLTASMAPLLEHNDLNRQLMGANMMRQWMPPADPEPALVRTGNEPDAPGFWGGRNLLTAFVSWGADNFEDGAVISESCARRLNDPSPIEAGDKISNRHGIKSVVCRIVPDDEMPHLPDGTPVELAWSFMGLPSRMGLMGALREAALGRIAHATGAPAIVSPYHAPSDEELRAALAQAALRDDGMETLTLGKSGPPLPRPTAVGWVYWGRLVHTAAGKLRVAVETPEGESQGEPEYLTLREAGAFETICEQFNTRAAPSTLPGTGREERPALAARLATGAVAQAPPPAPRAAELAARLAAAGIRMELAGSISTASAAPSSAETRHPEGALTHTHTPHPHSAPESDPHPYPHTPIPPYPHAPRRSLRFAFAPPEGAALPLARPIPHPWLGDRPFAAVGVMEKMPEYDDLALANARLARMLDGRAPVSLLERAQADLEARARAFCDALLAPAHLRFHARVLFQAQAVITSGPELRPDQVGIPDKVAWALFEPLLPREIGPEVARARDAQAAASLDALMARSWVLLNRRAPGTRAPFLAFHPVRCAGRAIRIHPLTCTPMDSDFDGDTLSLFLPVTEAGQREAGERLSMAATCARDPGFLGAAFTLHAGLWGLAALSLTPEGRQRLAQETGLAPEELLGPDGHASRAAVVAALERHRDLEGAEAALAAADGLMRVGFEAAKEAGASMGPFFGSSLPRPPLPEDDDPEAWQAYSDQLAERLAASDDFANPDTGAMLLALKSGARGSLAQLRRIIGPWYVRQDWGLSIIRHGYREGLAPEEVRLLVRGHWEGLDRASREWQEFEAAGPVGRGFHVLARAMRARRPGLVFAGAAATGEIDPLTDPDSRLFVGLGPSEPLD